MHVFSMQMDLTKLLKISQAQDSQSAVSPPSLSPSPAYFQRHCKICLCDSVSHSIRVLMCIRSFFVAIINLSLKGDVSCWYYDSSYHLQIIKIS